MSTLEDYYFITGLLPQDNTLAIKERLNKIGMIVNLINGFSDLVKANFTKYWTLYNTIYGVFVLYLFFNKL